MKDNIYLHYLQKICLWEWIMAKKVFIVAICCVNSLYDKNIYKWYKIYKEWYYKKKYR